MKNLDIQGVCASLINIIQIEGMSLSWPSHEALAHRVPARPFLTFTQPLTNNFWMWPRPALLSYPVVACLFAFLARPRQNDFAHKQLRYGADAWCFLVCRDQFVTCRSSLFVIRSVLVLLQHLGKKSEHRAGVGIQEADRDQ